MNKYVKTVLFFANGNIAVFDENNQQIQELQKYSAIDLFAIHAEKLGYELKESEFKCKLPNGSDYVGKIKIPDIYYTE